VGRVETVVTNHL